MKLHIKCIYYYKFETKLLLITNKNKENWTIFALYRSGRVGRFHSKDWV